MTTNVIKIDYGVRLDELKSGVIMKKDESFKYLVFSDAQSEPGVGVFAYMSKDMERWQLCFGAAVDGKPLDLKQMCEKVDEAIKELEGTPEVKK